MSISTPTSNYRPKSKKLDTYDNFFNWVAKQLKHPGDTIIVNTPQPFGYWWKQIEHLTDDYYTLENGDKALYFKKTIVNEKWGTYFEHIPAETIHKIVQERIKILKMVNTGVVLKPAEIALI